MPRSRSSVRPSPVIETSEPDSPNAGAPTRATGNLVLGFGTTAIPCNVYAGTEDNGIKRSEYTERDGKMLKVGRNLIVKDVEFLASIDPSDETSVVTINVERSEIVKLAEASDGTLVPLSDDEIAAAIGCEGGLAEIERFLPLSVMNAGTYIVDSLYQLRPAPARSGGTNRRSETTNKAFALLIKAMRLEGTFALCKVALRGKPRYAAFMPDGRLYTLRYTNEVRLPLPLPQIEVADSDLMLARMLVAAHTANIAPPLTDTSTAKVRAYLDAKAESITPDSITPELTPDRTYEDFIANLRAQVQGMALVPGTDVVPPAPRRRSRPDIFDPSPEPVPPTADMIRDEYTRIASDRITASRPVEYEFRINRDGEQLRVELIDDGPVPATAPW